MKLGKYNVEIINPDKVFFPKSGIPKQDLISYYKNVADCMLPYLKDRPLTLHRFPDGIGKEGFYQKDRSEHFPRWIKSVLVKKEDGQVDMVICNKTATLIFLINQGCITPHCWLSRKDKLHCPDKMIFDLDPPKDGFGLVVEAAKDLKQLFENQLDLKPYVMLTGSTGIHVVVPIRRYHRFDKVRAFAKNISEYLAKQYPKQYTTEVRVQKRKGRLFLDYLRNAYAQTGVAPYAVRPIEEAPVATPLEWQELNDKDLGPQSYNIRNILKRLSQKDDPWKDMMRHARSLDKAEDRFKALMKKAT